MYESVGDHLKRLDAMAIGPDDEVQSLHSRRDRLQGWHSVCINLGYRITLKVLIEGLTLIPIDTGSHDLVYRS